MKSSRHKKTPTLAGDGALVNEINYQEEIVMSDISTAVAKSNVVPFRSAMLLLVEHNGQPFVPMKPVVDGMGLDWKTQHRKLTDGRFKSTMVEMTIVAADGKLRDMTCMPLRKLAGWMMSIHPGKIQDEDRKKAIIDYQNECDDALWAYWNEGHAVNHRGPGQAMTVLGQTIGTDGFHMLGAVVKGKVSSLPAPIQRRATAKIWSQTHAAFGVRSAADIPADQLDAARNFIAAYAVLEGEFIPKGQGKSFDIPEKLGECERYLVSADPHGNRQVTPVPMGAFVLTRQQFMQSMLVDRDMPVSTAEMFEFVALATENLRCRFLFQAARRDAA